MNGEPIPAAVRPDRFGTIAGLRIIESLYLTEPGEPVTVQRTWRERLLTRPWRPLQASYTYRPMVPFRGAVRINDYCVVMHPATIATLKAQLQVIPPGAVKWSAPVVQPNS